MPKTSTRKIAHDRALVLAAEYRRLAVAGDWGRADQVEKTIDALVGYRNKLGAWAWPQAVRIAAFGS